MAVAYVLGQTKSLKYWGAEAVAPLELEPLEQKPPDVETNLDLVLPCYKCKLPLIKSFFNYKEL